MITIGEIEAKLQMLREEYKNSLHYKREIIKRQARALQIAKEKLEEKSFDQTGQRIIIEDQKELGVVLNH